MVHSPMPPRLLLTTLILATVCLSAFGSSGFIWRRGSQLMLDGKPFTFVGANAYWLMDQAKYTDKQYQVDQFFDACNKWGLKVIRMWAYNHNCPKAKGVYDQAEMKGFDYIVRSAGQRNIKIIFALGNTWNAYRSPEDFFRLAGIDPQGKDLLDWYRSDAVKAVYKDHMYNMVTRVNTYTGVAYRDDPTIAIWDVINEPRCPGCTEAWQQAVHLGWLNDMSAFLKSQVPKQLVAVGTEGYFMDSDNVKWNPGAGAQCEGEDWSALNNIPTIDVTTVHVYDRQMESVPPTWRLPDYSDLLNWFVKYLDAHVAVAQRLSKPLVIEEFNVIMPKFTPAQRTILFRVVLDYLTWQQSISGPLAGAMFWNAAIGSDAWDDGYNIYLDVPLVVPPPSLSKPAPSSNSGSTTPSSTPKPQTPEPEPEPVRKAVYVNTETLGDFRRGPQRDACAQPVAKWWLPAWDQSWARTVDIQSYTARTAGQRVQDVLRDAATLLAART